MSIAPTLLMTALLVGAVDSTPNAGQRPREFGSPPPTAGKRPPELIEKALAVPKPWYISNPAENARRAHPSDPHWKRHPGCPNLAAHELIEKGIRVHDARIMDAPLSELLPPGTLYAEPSDSPSDQASPEPSAGRTVLFACLLVGVGLASLGFWPFARDGAGGRRSVFEPLGQRLVAYFDDWTPRRVLACLGVLACCVMPLLGGNGVLIGFGVLMVLAWLFCLGRGGGAR